MADFSHKILAELEQAFADGEVETLLLGPPTLEEISAAVKVVHRPTGIEIECDDTKSQVENKAIALARLLRRLRAGEREE